MTALRAGQRITIHVPPSVPPQPDDGYLVLRSGASRSSRPIMRPGTDDDPYHVPNGRTVTVIGVTSQDGWTQVRTEDGQTGYIRTHIGRRDMFTVASGSEPPIKSEALTKTEPPIKSAACRIWNVSMGGGEEVAVIQSMSSLNINTITLVGIDPGEAGQGQIATFIRDHTRGTGTLLRTFSGSNSDSQALTFARGFCPDG